MILLIGKTYSKETDQARAYLLAKQVPFHYIDLEIEPASDEWIAWLKHHKILSIPVLLDPSSHHFIVDCQEEAIEALLKYQGRPQPSLT